MSDRLTRLTASVLRLGTVVASAEALITGLASEIRNNVDDTDALNALADDLDAKAAELGAAVAAVAPIQPEPAPVGDAPVGDAPAGDAPAVAAASKSK